MKPGCSKTRFAQQILVTAIQGFLQARASLPPSHVFPQFVARQEPRPPFLGQALRLLGQPLRSGDTNRE